LDDYLCGFPTLFHDRSAQFVFRKMKEIETIEHVSRRTSELPHQQDVVAVR